MSSRFLVFITTLLAYIPMGVAASAGQWSALPLFRVAGFYSDDYYTNASATQADPLIIPPTGSYDLKLLNVDINGNLTGPLTNDIDEFSDPWPFPEDDMIIGRWEVYVNGQLEYYSGTSEILNSIYDYTDATEETIIEIRWLAKDTGIHFGKYYIAADDYTAGGWDLTGSIWLKVDPGGRLAYDKGLPDSNLNNQAGANRSNIRWATPVNHSPVGQAESFRIAQAGQWTVGRVRFWVVPDVAASFGYSFGDLFSDVTLYTGTSSASLLSQQSGSFTAGANTSSNSKIVATPVTYAGGVHYQDFDGRFHQIWQVDVEGIQIAVSGQTDYLAGLVVTPRFDRWPFLHASQQTQGNGAFYSFIPGQLPVVQNGAVWFNGKQTDLNIQVFAY